MKKDYNTKKKATIAALSLTAVCLTVGLFYYVGTLNNSEASTLPTDTQSPTESQVVVSAIEITNTPNPTDMPKSTDTPKVTDTPNPTNKPKPTEKPKTPEETKPPAEPPKTIDGEEKTPHKTPEKPTSGADTSKDHEFKPENPSKPPEYKPEQTEPNSNAGKPKDGDTKDGKIYIEGFGWIEDEGGNTQDTAPNAGTGKPVGEM